MGEGLQVDEHRRQVGGSRVHVLASAGGRLAQGVDHQVELVANLRIERVEHLVDFDRGQRMVLVDGAALRDGPLRGMAAIELHVRFPQQVLLPDHGAGVLEDGREVLVQQHADLHGAGHRSQRLDLAHPQPGH